MDGLPSASGPFDPDAALSVVKITFETMEPDGQLTCGWEEFSGLVLGWSREQTAISLEALRAVRMSMERVCGDNESGDFLVCAAKFAISACLLGAGNPYVLIADERDPMHNDTGLLTEKAVKLLHLAAASDHFDPTVRMDYDTHRRMEEAAEVKIEQREETSKAAWLGDLLSNAVKPDEG